MQQEIKYGQLWARHSVLVEANQVGTYRISFEGLKEAVDEAMSIQHPVTIGWVSASEFKFKQIEYRPCRFREAPGEDYDYGEIYITEDDGAIFLDVDHENEYIPQNDGRWLKYDILDETGQSNKLPNDVVEKILKVRDYISIGEYYEAYHHLYGIASPGYDSFFPWKEMEEQVSYVILNEVQLKESKQSNKDANAVAFAEWLNEGYISVEKRDNIAIYVEYGPQEYHRKQQYSIEQLYNEYQKQNKQ